MTFPYIKQIKVNDCFTYQNFSIPDKELESFKHIVLTGKNGSGKTTILDRIAFILSQLKEEGKTQQLALKKLKGILNANLKHPHRTKWEEEIRYLQDIELFYVSGINKNFIEKTDEIIVSYFKAHRKIDLKEVSTVTKEEDFLTNLKKGNQTDNFINQFKQYLVNKKVYEAFAFMDSKNDKINQSKVFFDKLTDTLKSIFDDKKIELEFVQENFEFYIIFGDKRRVTFNQLSEGFSAFLSIIMDLLMRTDLIRKTKNDYTIEPEGIVIIDEPETHFHLSMQYEILPLINKLFPKLQLIIATHSPAIISSIKNAVIYDLSSKEEVSEWVLGSSYSELMVNHFGLGNEYSSIADKVIEEVNQAVKDKNIEKLNQIMVENQNILTPTLRIEIESQIIHIKSL